MLVQADWATLVPALEIAGPRPLFSRVRPPPPARPPVVPGVEPAGAPSGGSAPAASGVLGAILAVPPDQREVALLPHLERRAREVMRLDPSRPLPITTALADLGFDSLMATELKSALLADGLDVPLGRVLGGPSLEELANMVAARLPAGDAPRAAAVAAAVAPRSETAGAADAPDHTLIWTHLAALIVGIGLASAVWALL